MSWVSLCDINDTIILEMNKKNKTNDDNLWCHYSGMPSPKSYMKCEDCGDSMDECTCIVDTVDLPSKKIVDVKLAK